MKKQYLANALRGTTLLVLVAQSLTYSNSVSASCGASFCLINTDWAVQGAWLDHGSRFDLRFEQVKQNQLMSGSKKLSDIELDRFSRELETSSQRLVLNFDHGINQNWAISASLPFVVRQHAHLESSESVSWNYRQFGDARIVARYQAPIQENARGGVSAFGVSAGLKLANGKYDIANSTGTRAERSLQPGSGTTNLLASVYYRRVLSDFSSSWFVQANLESPLNEKDGYKPGRSLGLDFGLRGEWGAHFSPLLQLNYQSKQRDSGLFSEPENSGGHSLSLSPGLSYKLAPQSQVYALVQLPLQQSLRGQQLGQKWAFTFGIQSKF